MVVLGLDDVVATVVDFAARLAADRVRLNELNVFPVADGDTGTNMVRTLASIVDSLQEVDDLCAAEAAVEAAALNGRGNSGLIIGQFLAGFVAAGDGSVVDLAAGVQNGARRARDAVASPVEGTMLTVADAAAARLGRGAECSVDELIDAVRAAVDATPSQLPVLAERGVVDSGAAGLSCFFEAVRTVVTGEVDEGDSTPTLISCDVGLNTGPGLIASGYEVQFRVGTELVEANELSQLLLDLGTDVVVASSTVEHSAHVHVADPNVTTSAIAAALETRPGVKAISFRVEPILASDPASRERS